MHRSPVSQRRGIGTIRDLTPTLIGQDPGAYEMRAWDMFRASRQSPGGIVAKAIAGIDCALLDVKAKALGISVTELFGGPTRDSVRVYWSHCGTSRARYPELLGDAAHPHNGGHLRPGQGVVVQRGFTRPEDQRGDAWRSRPRCTAEVSPAAPAAPMARSTAPGAAPHRGTDRDLPRRRGTRPWTSTWT